MIMNFCSLPQSQEIFEMRRARPPEPCRTTGLGGGQGWFKVSGDWGAYIDWGVRHPKEGKTCSHTEEKPLGKWQKSVFIVPICLWAFP